MDGTSGDKGQPTMSSYQEGDNRLESVVKSLRARRHPAEKSKRKKVKVDKKI